MTKKQIAMLMFLWQRISVGADDDCWEWAGPISTLGYGRVSLGGKERKAHRELYRLLHPGTNLKGLHVRHLCHNRKCCNPAHLKHGTALENKADSLRDDRLGGVAKLSAKQVASILRRVEGGESQTDIAKSLGVSFKTVNRICKGFTWTHITGIRRSA